MGNMSYCRFENCCGDLADCADHIEDLKLSDSERRYRKRLIETCMEIVRTAENCGLIEDDEVVEGLGPEDEVDVGDHNTSESSRLAYEDSDA